MPPLKTTQFILKIYGIKARRSRSNGNRSIADAARSREDGRVRQSFSSSLRFVSTHCHSAFGLVTMVRTRQRSITLERLTETYRDITPSEREGEKVTENELTTKPVLVTR